MDSYRSVLEAVREGKTSVEEALLQLQKEPFADIGLAKIDFHRRLRKGAQEVVYGAGKTAEQIVAILQAMEGRNALPVLITRLEEEKALKVQEALPAMAYHPEGRIGILGEMPAPDGKGKVLVLTAGTSDIPVAEEAALTAEFLGNEVVRCYDAGVAGLHRLLAHLDEIMEARVIIAIAGMEGALPSVVGGLASCPVLAVPTSVGYGASLGGISALLSMLNSCASGVSVVNIDNGFGAAFQASLINHLA